MNVELRQEEDHMTNNPFTPLMATLPPDVETQNPTRRVLSTPTTCLHCHLIVQMSFTPADPENTRDNSFWSCPRCHKNYPARFWRIKRAAKPKKQIA
jgi:hypothetical protein